MKIITPKLISFM